jgi:serine/threonine protein kinase
LFDEDEEDATLKVVDFGFAKLMKGSQALKTPCYTEQYAAPEVLDDDPEYDESCDMWSLGVILYTMLCGYAPFRVQGRSSSSLYKAVQSELRFPAREWDVIGPDAKDLVRHLLDVNPQRRLTPQAVLDHAWLRAPGADAESTGALATEVDRFGPFNVCGQIASLSTVTGWCRPRTASDGLR